MKKRISALLLSIVLCLAMVCPAFADDTNDPVVTVNVVDGNVEVTVTGVTDGITRTSGNVYHRTSENDMWSIVGQLPIRGTDGTLTGTLLGGATSSTGGVFTKETDFVRVDVEYKGGFITGYWPLADETVAVTGVTLDNETLALEVGGTGTLVATVSPEDATNKNLTWSSSDEAVATVDENGVVTAVGAGTATITVTTEDGPFTATCEVTVTAPEVPTYTITVAEVTGGTVTTDVAEAAEGATVTVTVAASSGYTFSTLSVTDAEGNPVSCEPSETAGSYTFTMPASNVTVTATFTANGNTDTEPTPTPTPSGSIGGVSRYTITINSSEHGTVTASSTSVTAGTTVKLTVTPEDGYELDTLVVTDASGNSVTVTQNEDGTYSFTMPSNKVTVDATFKVIGSGTGTVGGFTDVYSDDWYADAVAWAVENGITTGKTDTLFAPKDGCTRKEVVTFIWRAAGSPEPTSDTNPFSDVSETGTGAPYYKAILWAIEKGITIGTSETTFSPDLICTRAQIVTFLYRYSESESTSTNSGFSDVPASAYYASAVTWAVDAGVTNGTSATTFSPKDNCNRAQIVTFLYRLLVKSLKD